jgi:hypothetical protein
MLAGGLNLETSPVAMKPGELVDCQNIECLIDGGYGVIDGYVKITDQEVPGVGPVKTVYEFKDEIYAIREDESNGRLYRLGGESWEEVTLPEVWSLNGEYQVTEYNFYAQDSQNAMFIVNGIDKPVMLDNNGIVQISLGDGPHNASRVTGFKSKLVLALESSLFFSKAGEPTNYEGAEGASEVALGETITELHVSQGALLVGCTESTHVIYGVFDEQLEPQSLNKTGVTKNTMQSIAGQILSAEGSGITVLSASKNYGNFDAESLTRRVRGVYRTLFESNYEPVSFLSKKKSQYRIFWGNLGLYITYSSNGLSGITKVRFDENISCGYNSERMLFGSESGFVFELDKGASFSGAKITSILSLAYDSMGSPSTRKRYRKVVIDARAREELATVYLNPSFDYSGSDLPVQSWQVQPTSFSGGGLWDVTGWDQFYWDSQYFSTIEARLSGVGKNMGLIISTENTAAKLELYSVTLHYSQRGLSR